jgi:DNA (cytosine-5)-methyltransferase 1
MRYASVCDGIGAAHVAWQPLGWQCSWTSEIEPFPAAVVEHHFGFPNVGDMTKITEEMLDGYGPVDLLVGGTPCQSFSVAGLRGGLADPRGNLALRFVQLAAVMQPKWIVWENVPGVLSSGKGRDFGTFLGALGELGYGFAYRILDAQWFGVAQRRRRVFVIGHLGDWRRAAAVLFERESVFGNPPTRGAKGQGITSSPEGIAGNVSSKWAKGTGGPAGDECYNLVSPTMSCFGQGDTRATTVVAIQERAICENPDAGPDGAGVRADGVSYTLEARTVPQAVAFANRTRDGIKVPEVMKDGLVPALTNPGKGGRSDAVNVAVAMAFKPGQSEAAGGTFVTEEFAPTLQSTSNGSTAVPAVAFRENQRGEVAYVDPPHALASGGGKPGQGYCGVLQSVAYSTKLHNTTSNGAGKCYEEYTAGIDANSPAPALLHPMAVRRLTPRECERLQGFPDDYTLVEYRKKPAADGPRYRALGNSMAVPVMRWIGERIKMVDELRSSP